MKSSQLVHCLILTASLLVGSSATAEKRGDCHDTRLPGRVLAHCTIHDVHEVCQRCRALTTAQAADIWAPFLQGWDASQPRISDHLRRELGVTLDEFRALGLGKVTLAVVKVPDRSVSIVAMLDFQSHRSMNLIVGRFAQAMRSGGFRQFGSMTAGTWVTVFRRDQKFRELALCMRDSVLCLSTNPSVLRDVVCGWNSRPCLNRPAQFAEVAECCRSGDGVPLLSWYVDPVGLIQELVLDAEPDDSEFRRFVLGLIPRAGLDQLKAIGGTVDCGGKESAFAARVQIVVDEPRSGILSLLELEPVARQPPAWISADSTFYTSVNWDLQSCFRGGNELLSILEGENALNAYVTRLKSVTDGFDVRRDLLDRLTGRIHLAGLGANDERQLMVGLQVHDPPAIVELLKTTTEKRFLFTREPSTSREVGDLTVYTQSIGKKRIFIALVGDTLIFSGRESVFTDLQQPSLEPLRESPDYRRVAACFPDTCLLQAYDTSNEALRVPYRYLRLDTTPDQTLGIDFTLLPGFDDLREILGPSATCAVQNDKGMLYTHFILYESPVESRPALASQADERSER